MDRLHEKRRHRAIVFVDSSVHRSHPALAHNITCYFRAHAQHLQLAAPPQIIPGGERIKNNLPLAMRLLRSTSRLQLCRHSFVIAIGGGAVLDAVGLIASLIHRGLRLIRVPTTALAQNDAGVGVKNGLNLDGKKNLIGTFAPPFAVLNDFHFLTTLPDSAWSDGIAEAFKVAIIRDAAFFGFLSKNARKLRACTEERQFEVGTDRRAVRYAAARPAVAPYQERRLMLMEQLVRRCAGLHLKHIRTSGDPFEMGHARPLDFGHWSAHKLEQMTRHRLSHGQAVAIGIALDSAYATLKGWITRKEFTAIHNGLTQAGLTLWHPALEKRKRGGGLEILDGLRDFQEHLGGNLCVTFPKGIGKAFEVHEINANIVKQAIRQLRSHG